MNHFIDMHPIIAVTIVVLAFCVIYDLGMTFLKRKK